MAIKIADVGRIAEKFARVTPGRAADYAAGIDATDPGAYAQAALAAAGAQAAGVQAAIARKAYDKAVAAAGPKWKAKASVKGARNYGPAVAEAGPDYAAGFAPYQAVIAGLTLPAKGPRGAPQNYDRVRFVGEALRKKKTGV